MMVSFSIGAWSNWYLDGQLDIPVVNSVVPGFLVQTGDRTGTGAGGESFYGGE